MILIVPLLYLLGLAIICAFHLAFVCALLEFITARSLPKNERRQRVWIGILLLIPSTAFIAYFHQDRIYRVIETIQFRQACRRDTSIEAPASPIPAYGIELATPSDTRSRAFFGKFEAPAGDPMFYLGAKGRPAFAFVEQDGIRYTGTVDDYTTAPFEQSEADHSISLMEERDGALWRVQMTIVARYRSKRMGNFVGFQYYAQCPAHADGERFVHSTLKPAPRAAAHSIKDSATVTAHALDPDDIEPPSPEAGARFTGPLAECPTLLDKRMFKGGDTLRFAFGKGERTISLKSAEGTRLKILDLACRAGEVLVLSQTPGIAVFDQTTDSDVTPLIVHRYAHDGSLMSRHAMALVYPHQALATQAPKRALPTRVRRMHWIDREVAFEFFEEVYVYDDKAPRYEKKPPRLVQTSLGWFGTTLPVPTAELSPQ